MMRVLVSGLRGLSDRATRGDLHSLHPPREWVSALCQLPPHWRRGASAGALFWAWTWPRVFPLLDISEGRWDDRAILQRYWQEVDDPKWAIEVTKYRQRRNHAANLSHRKGGLQRLEQLRRAA